jgi:hypothetical protein
MFVQLKNLIFKEFTFLSIWQFTANCSFPFRWKPFIIMLAMSSRVMTKFTVVQWTAQLEEGIYSPCYHFLNHSR